MSQDNPFLETILANPDDDTPRLVYADWLEEHGETERAEFLRLECQLARLPKTATEFVRLHQRMWILRRKLDESWGVEVGVRTILDMPASLHRRTISSPREVRGEVAEPAGPRGFFARVEFRVQPFHAIGIIVEDRCEANCWGTPEFWSGTIAGLRQSFDEEREREVSWHGLRIIILAAKSHPLDSSLASFREAAYRGMNSFLRSASLS